MSDSSLPSASTLPRWPVSPAASLVERFQAGAEPGEGDPGLVVEAIGFVRDQGDWLGVLVTPTRLDLFLLPGGGALWGDIPAGQRRYVDLYGATLPFVAVDDAILGPYQFSPLVDTLDRVPDMTTAREIAHDALRAYLPPVAPAPVAVPQGEAEAVSRRGFFRRLAGKR